MIVQQHYHGSLQTGLRSGVPSTFMHCCGCTSIGPIDLVRGDHDIGDQYMFYVLVE
jgi:hypothetical protein